MKIDNIKNIIVLVIVILVSLFYWYEYRPSQVRKDCSTRTCMGTNSRTCIVPYSLSGADKEQIYKNCLREKGIEN